MTHPRALSTGLPSALNRDLPTTALALTLFAAITIHDREAAAYCVAHACNPDGDQGHECGRDATTGCPSEGPALFRPSGCIYFGVQADAGHALGLDDAELEQAILDAFDAWAAVDCGDGAPSIAAQSVGAVAVDDPFACTKVPELNVDVWLISDALSEGLVTANSGATAGLTRPSFVSETGLVFDADVLLNELWLLVQSDHVLLDHLRVVGMHEAGHALGLGHSLDEEALMHRDYRVTADRDLTQDDIDGICALYPPKALDCAPPRISEAAFSRSACSAAYQEKLAERESVEPSPREPGASTGCGAVGSPGEGWHAYWPLALGLAVWRVRRRLGHATRRGTACAAALLLLSCSSPSRTGQPEETEPLATEDAPARAAHAAQAPDDPELLARIERLAQVCSLMQPTLSLRCKTRADEELAGEFLRSQGSRLAALPTLARLLGSEDEMLRAIAARTLSIGFSARLGDDLRAGSISSEVASMLLQALGELPLAHARRVAPAAVHAAMLSGQSAALHAALAARADDELTRIAFRRLMVHGRLRALPEIEAAASGGDSKLAVAALEAPRNMPEWSEKEQDKLCPWLLGFLGHADAARAARAAQALASCRGRHVTALLERGRALHARGELDRARLTAFRDVCLHEDNTNGPWCARNLEFLESLLGDSAAPSSLRTGALAALSYQVSQGQGLPGGGAPDSAILSRLARQYANDPVPQVARRARSLLERLKRSAAEKAPETTRSGSRPRPPNP